MIVIAPDLTIEDHELKERFSRASGPGGQNVNKVSTAVELRFDVWGSPNLSDTVRARLKLLAGRRLTKQGVLVITAQRHRTQARNRADARHRLLDLLRRAAVAPLARERTWPTPGAKRRRLATKQRRAALKRRRTEQLTED